MSGNSDGRGSAIQSAAGLSSHSIYPRGPRWRQFLAGVLTLFAISACQKPSNLPPPASPQLSAISISTQSDSVSIETPSAKFQILSSGYLRGYLKRDGARTYDGRSSRVGCNRQSADTVVIDGKEVSDFQLDFSHAQISEASHRLGPLGKRIEIKGTSKSRPEIEKTVSIECYDNFPSLALATAAYKNDGTTPVKFETVISQRHELNASLIDPRVPPFAMWSFHGSSEKWGKENVLLISKDFSRANPMEQVMPGDPGTGGGIPVVAFWTGEMGEAIGHLETLPLVACHPSSGDSE